MYQGNFTQMNFLVPIQFFTCKINCLDLFILILNVRDLNFDFSKFKKLRILIYGVQFCMVSIIFTILIYKKPKITTIRYTNLSLVIAKHQNILLKVSTTKKFYQINFKIKLFDIKLLNCKILQFLCACCIQLQKTCNIFGFVFLLMFL